MPRTRLILLAALCAVILATSCSHAGEKDGQAGYQPEPRHIDLAIREASAAWSQAATAKDLDNAVAFYADDAVQFPNKAPAARGKENIRKNWAALLALPGHGLSWQTSSVEVARSVDLAYETGAYNFVTTDKKGKTNDEKGKYVVSGRSKTTAPGESSWILTIPISKAKAKDVQFLDCRKKSALRTLKPQFPAINHPRLPPHCPLNPSNQIKFLPPAL